MSKMEGRGNLFLLFLCPLPEFSSIGDLWDRRKFYDVRSVFPEIGIFGSSWDHCKFCGEIDFDRKRLPFFGRNVSSWESWDAPAQTKFPFYGSAHPT